MITLYTWTTPNGRKASVMVEETGLDYTAVPVNIGKNEQFAPDFLAVSPNNKIPAIVDEQGVDRRQTVFETSAILTYLAEKTGRLLAAHGPRRVEALEWLAWSISGYAPMLGQWNYFANRAQEKTPAAIKRFGDEAIRLYGVLERRLAVVQSSRRPGVGGDVSDGIVARTYPPHRTLDGRDCRSFRRPARDGGSEDMSACVRNLLRH